MAALPAFVLLLVSVISLTVCEDTSNEIGRAEQFQAQIKAEEAIDSHPTELKMPALSPIPANCVDDLLRRSEPVFNRHLARRRRSFDDLDQPNPRSTAEAVDKFLKPLYLCSLEQRVGVGGAGGKWVCRGTQRMQDVSPGELGVVSVGSRGVTGFEEDMSRLFGSITDTFDPFIPGPALRVAERLPYLRLHSTGLLGSRDLDDWKAGPRSNVPMVTIAELLQSIDRETVDVFKIACEGCEYGFAVDLAGVRASSQVLGQMLMEISHLNDTRRFLGLMSGLETAGYRMFHAESNPYAASAYDVAFVHESQLRPSQQDGRELSPSEDESCYAAFARQAEAIYNANWARKQRPFIERGLPEITRRLKWEDAVTLYMVGTYPCQLVERFGEWGRGGAWVCMRHKESCPGVQTRGEYGTIVTIGAGTMAGASESLFEEELGGAMNARTHIFNPGLGAKQLYLQESNSRPTITHHNQSVCGRRFSSEHHLDCISFRQMLELLQVDSIQVLRLDCMNCEFELVTELKTLYFSKPKAIPIGQIVMRMSKHQLTQPALRNLHLMGYRTFVAEKSGAEFEVSLIHDTCL